MRSNILGISGALPTLSAVFLCNTGPQKADSVAILLAAKWDTITSKSGMIP